MNESNLSNYNVNNQREALMRLYPEINEAGGFGSAIIKNEALATVKLESDRFGFCCIAAGRRNVQISLALAERLFLGGFWSEGVLLANIKTSDMAELRRAVRAWLEDDIELQGLQAVSSNVEPTARARDLEKGLAADSEWLRYLSSPDLDLKLLAQTAVHRPLLRQLLPFRSLNTFRFSLKTGYPYTWDLPYFELIGNGKFRAIARYGGKSFQSEPTDVLLSEGNAEEVVDALMTVLPTSIGSATSGTADDVIEF